MSKTKSKCCQAADKETNTVKRILKKISALSPSAQKPQFFLDFLA